MIGQFVFVFIRIGYVVIDVLCVFASIFLSCWLRKAAFPVSLRELFLDTANPFYHVFISWLALVLFYNGLFRLYQTRREIMETHEAWLVVRSVLSAAATALVFVFSMKIEGFPRSAFFLLVFFTMLSLCLWRVLKHGFVSFLAARGWNNFNVLVIGAGNVGLMLVEEFRENRRLGFRFVGFLDDKKTSADLGGDYKVLGRIEDLPEVLQRYFITAIFVSVHPGGTVFHRILETAREHKIAVRVVPEAFDRATGEIFKYNIGFIPILEYCDLGQNRRQYGKRPFDFAASLIALIVLSPVFAAIAALICIDNPGPVFYFSRRYGRDGRLFKMWKFRSMVVGADEKLKEIRHMNEVDGPIFKIRRDPRVTRIGRFLRKYSLDELPQLLNVLIGDMSLVGPRPLLMDQVETEDLKQLKRLAVRPGLTGLWQVRGRSDLPFHRLIRWDSWYVNNWSFMLDISILLKTIPVVIKGKGAY